MAILMGRSLGTAPWDKSNLVMAPETAKVRTSIISSILAQFGQVRCLVASTESLDAGGMVICKNQRLHVEVMEV